jgi:hypothetical protein
MQGTEEVFVPHLAALLQQYFMIMNEVGSDEVVQALDMIIDRFDRYASSLTIIMSTDYISSIIGLADWEGGLSEGLTDDVKCVGNWLGPQVHGTARAGHGRAAVQDFLPVRLGGTTLIHTYPSIHIANLLFHC